MAFAVYSLPLEQLYDDYNRLPINIWFEVSFSFKYSPISCLGIFRMFAKLSALFDSFVFGLAAVAEGASCVL